MVARDLGDDLGPELWLLSEVSPPVVGRFALHVVGRFAPGPLAQLDRGHFFVPHPSVGFIPWFHGENGAAWQGTASCREEMYWIRFDEIDVAVIGGIWLNRGTAVTRLWASQQPCSEPDRYVSKESLQ